MAHVIRWQTVNSKTLKKQLALQQKKIEQLEARLTEYHGLEEDLNHYVASLAQQQEAIQKKNQHKLDQQIDDISQIGQAYKQQSNPFLGWLNKKKRHQQINALEQTAISLQTEQDFTKITEKIGLYFQNADNLSDEQKSKLNIINQSMILYGALITTQQQIKNETNLFPSQLKQLINTQIEELELNIYHLSEGLLDKDAMAEKSIKAFQHYMRLHA